MNNARAANRNNNHPNNNWNNNGFRVVVVHGSAGRLNMLIARSADQE